MNTSVSCREFVWLLAATALILLCSSLPLMAGTRAETADQIFSGAIFDRQDYAVHLATMQIGARGEWAYQFQFTSEAHEGAYIKQFYLLLGHAARWLGDVSPKGPAATFQGARLLLGGAASFSVYLLMAQFFEGVFARQLAFLLAILAGGFGWLQLLTGWLPDPSISPMDFWLVDAYVFFGMSLFPHFAASIALMCGMLTAYLQYLSDPRWRWGIAAAGMAVALQWIQPFSPLLPDLAMGMAWIASWRARPARVRQAFGALALIGVAQLPLLAYNLSVLRTNPAFAEFARQNTTLSPPPLYYLAGFGLAGVLAIVGIIAGRTPARWPLLAWVVAAFAAAYAPWNLQRRFMLAITIPLAAFAVDGLRFLWLTVERRGRIRQRRNLWASLVLLVAALSSMYISVGTAAFLGTRPASLFDPAPVVAAVDWLAEHARPEDVVLAETVEASQLVAARAGLAAYWGHPIETLDFQEKADAVRSYYAGRLGANWLGEAGIDWVIATSGAGLATPGVSLAYERDGILIFRIAP